MNTLWSERPAWLAVDPGAGEEEAHATEEVVYHRPVLQREVLELLKPRASSLIVDGTCGGGGHTEELLESGAEVLALDQDPDAVQHVTERLARFGRANSKTRSAVLASCETVRSTCAWTRKRT